MPGILLDNCTQCLKCVDDCPSDAIDIELGAINDTCIHCGHCVAICPESTVFPETGGIVKLHASPVSPQDFRHLSAGIRTCRSFQNKEVELEVLDLLVENMRHYPSASNARPVEITILTNKAYIQRLNDRTVHMLIRKLQKITSPLVKPLFRILAPKFDRSKLVYYRKRFISRQVPGSSQICHHSPVIMLFHSPVAKYGMGDADAQIWSTYTSLYANTLGLGTCFNGFIVQAMQRSKSMRKECNIPDHHRVNEALLIGYPRVKYTNEAGRKKPKSNLI